MVNTRDDAVAMLALANVSRLAIPGLRADVLAGRATVATALADPCVTGKPVSFVVQWLPRWGPVRTERMLRGLQPPVSYNRRCGELTARQRALIEQAVR